MPTEREREYYRMGFTDGLRVGRGGEVQFGIDPGVIGSPVYRTATDPKRKRKLSAWNKFVKNPRNHIKYRDGKLNLKKMGIAYRRKKRR